MNGSQSYKGRFEENRHPSGVLWRWFRCVGHEPHGATYMSRQLTVIVLCRNPLERSTVLHGEPGFALEIGLMGTWNRIGRCRSGAPASRRAARRALWLYPPPAARGSTGPRTPSFRRRTTPMGCIRSVGRADGSPRAATRVEEAVARRRSGGESGWVT